MGLYVKIALFVILHIVLQDIGLAARIDFSQPNDIKLEGGNAFTALHMRRFLTNDDVESAKNFLKDVIISCNLLNDTDLVEHMVQHGHMGEIKLPTREITSESDYKLNLLPQSYGSIKPNRVYTDTPRSVFLNKNTSPTKADHIRIARIVLNEIREIIANTNFTIKSCTIGKVTDSVELILDFNQKLESVRSLYADAFGKNISRVSPCITVCMYLKLQSDEQNRKSLKIISIFPVKNKEDLWEHEGVQNQAKQYTYEQ